MHTYFEVEPQERFDPHQIIEDMANSNSKSLLIDEGVLPDGFFDLSTGIAGELLHKTSTYRVRLACVVADPSIYSQQFESFVHEANRRNDIGFFTTRDEAIRWLETT